VRIVAQLIDAESDRHLWVETYDRRLTDVFAIQTDVALQIAAALKAELSPDEKSRLHHEPTSDLQAYQLYLQGRHCYLRYTAEGSRRGIEYFEQAIAQDPTYALAYTALAMAYTELAETGALRPDEDYARARDASAKALALDPGLGEAHCMLAYITAVYDFNWVAAEQEFKRALELTPNSADTYDLYGRMCLALDRNDEALAMERRAQELDPLAHRADVARALLRAGRYDEALQAATHAVELDPHYARAHATLGWAYLKKGIMEQGVAELEIAVSLSPGETLWLAQLGQAYGMVGNVESARSVLHQLEELSRQRFVSPYHIAFVHTGLGEQDSALDWLERAYEDRSGPVYSLRGSFLFTTLHAHPRFTALLKRMNLAPAGDPMTA
jgi:tetratricopeptide (TPR) repeat protein